MDDLMEREWDPSFRMQDDAELVREIRARWTKIEVKTFDVGSCRRWRADWRETFGGPTHEVVRPISELELSFRTAGSLREAGIELIGERD